MEVTVISWNVYHGRDAPPDPGLAGTLSRLTGRTANGPELAQVNRELLDQFISVLDRRTWDVALLQECPPRWHASLAARFDAQAHAVPTARNWAGRLRSALARRNPDLVGSAEGGSNLTLVRGAVAPIALRRELTLRPSPGLLGSLTGLPERRAMAFTECASGLCIANLHATNDRPELAAKELEVAASAATEWAGERPLVLAGDFNLRPAEHPNPFATLTRRHSLSAPSEPRAIDHILVRGLTFESPPSTWEAERREIREGGMRIRLSDHAPVEARLVRA